MLTQLSEGGESTITEHESKYSSNDIDFESPIIVKKNPKTKKTYIDLLSCKMCGEQFKSAQSLGGHISRKHPKTSD